jgi:hypothetical protein
VKDLISITESPIATKRKLIAPFVALAQRLAVPDREDAVTVQIKALR